MSSLNESKESSFSVKHISKFSSVTDRIKSSNFTLCFLKRVERRGDVERHHGVSLESQMRKVLGG